MKVEINKGKATARQLPAFRQQVTELSARLDSLRAVLPEEKDVSDLLRRLQTLATQSNLTIRSFKPAPIVQKETHAEWPIELELDGTYHNLGLFFDRVEQVPANRQRQERAHQGEGQAAARLHRRGAVRGHDLRAGRGAEIVEKGKPGAKGAKPAAPPAKKAS